MRILYDGYIYRLQKAGGINRYFSELIARLPPSATPVLYGCSHLPMQAPEHPRLVYRRTFPFGRYSEPFASAWSATFQIVHPSYYHLTEPLHWPRLRGAVVLTVYDFVFKRYGHLYERSSKLLAAQKAAIDRADLILCISNSTQKDLAEFHPEAAGRSRVIHLGTSKFAAGVAARNPTRPYVLFVGARVFYKNFCLAVRALSLARQKGCEVDLIAAGAPWTAAEKELLREERMENFTHLVEYPADADLAALYKGALCLLYPSEYEGFGLPPLEAMSLGTPVLALSRSSIPEVVGESGILIDPSDEPAEAFSAAIHQLLDDPSRRAALSALAQERAAQFSWERTATETFAAYQSLVGQHPQ